ncbi:MAG: phosphate ABC transporter substrate-binding/OmpA family protein [Chitinophagales bacterium]
MAEQKTRLTGFSKFIITLLIVGGIGGGLYYLANNTEIGKELANKEKKEKVIKDNKGKNAVAATSNGDAIKVQAFTWGGYAGGQYFNEGFKHSAKSRFTKDYGLDVDFMLIDDFDASRSAWKADEVHLLGTTADALSTEMEGLKEYNPQILFQVDWSRGGDAIVARRGINSINDLKGKTVAVTPSTPSQTFLIWMLEAAGMTLDDIKVQEVPSAIDAATAFKSGKIDGAVVWSPDDEIIIRDVPGAKVLQSTRDASHIVADVYIAKKSWVDANRDKVGKLYEGFMIGAAEINASEAAKKKAAKIMADGTGISEKDALGGINNVRLTTHGDNLNFFGRNPDYKGVTGEKLYTKMGQTYEKLGFAKKGWPNWRTISYPGAISSANLKGDTHIAEGGKVFKKPTEKQKTAPAIASKPISISFPTGKSELGENAKTIIDLQFGDVAKAFSNARIRVEGNTDNVGSATMNKKLSLKRAQSVAKYLEKAYDMDVNRFIIVGNGPDRPVKGCEKNDTDACRSKNRRTEFQLVAE